MGERLPLWPGFQVVGNALRLLCEQSCDLAPEDTSRNRTVPAPVGLKIAIQYLVPVVILAAGTATEFQAPLAGFVMTPCVNKMLGLLAPVSLYKPAITCVAVLPLSI